MLNIFESIKNSFFSPASSEQKDLYLDFMDYLISSKSTSISFKTERERIRDLLMDFIKDNLIKYDKESLEDDYERLSNNAFSIISVYINSGWLEEEIDLSGQRWLIITPACVSFFKFLNEIKENTNMMTGSVLTIKNNILSDSLDYATIMQVKNDTMTLNNSLRNM